MRQTLLLFLAFVALSGDALAARKRGSDVIIANVRVEVDLDAETVSVVPLHGKLDGVEFTASLFSQNALEQTATFVVSVRNESDRTLFHHVEAEVGSAPEELDPAGNWDIPFELLRVGSSTSPAQWTAYHGALRAWTMSLRLRSNVPLLAGERAAIRHPGGLSVVVPEGAIPYEAFVDVETVDAPDPVADAGDMEWLGGVRLTLLASAVHSAMPPPDLPLEIRIRSKQDPGASAEFVAALLLDAERVTEDELQQGSERFAHWLPVSHVIAKAGKLRTAAEILGGVIHPGTYGLFRAAPRLYVRGVVRDADGPRPGAIVKALHSPIVAVSDANGAYVLPVPSLASVSITALDPLRGQRGVGSAGAVGGARIVNVDVLLSPMSGEVVTRDGIRNGGFEADILTGWVSTPSAAVLTSTSKVGVPTSPLVCSGATIEPSEANAMVSLTTVAPDLASSSLSQPFDVPAGVGTLRFDYNVLSSEFTTGTPAPDYFVATVTTPLGDMEVVRIVTDDPAGTSVIGDCGDGENWAETGWRSASVDLSLFSGGVARLRLVFSVVSAIDASLPTRVLIDNVRFATLWVAPKQIAGAAGDSARSTSMTEGATQILRQAGINVRSRPLVTVPDPGGILLLLDITLSGSSVCPDNPLRQDIYLTSAMSSLLGSARSVVPTDLNAWWVQRFTGLVGFAYAIGPDDFCTQVTLATNGGIVLTDTVGGNGLAHEAGHIMISPEAAGHSLEHRTEPGNFMLSNTPLLGVVSREQSFNINRPTAPLLVP